MCVWGGECVCVCVGGGWGGGEGGGYAEISPSQICVRKVNSESNLRTPKCPRYNCPGLR